MDLELMKRCGELAGVLHEETGLQVEVHPFKMVEGCWIVLVVGERWSYSVTYHDEELLAEDPREIAHRMGQEIRERLRTPEPEHENEQNDEGHRDMDEVCGISCEGFHGDHRSMRGV